MSDATWPEQTRIDEWWADVSLELKRVASSERLIVQAERDALRAECDELRVALGRAWTLWDRCTQGGPNGDTEARVRAISPELTDEQRSACIDAARKEATDA